MSPYMTSGGLVEEEGDVVASRDHQRILDRHQPGAQEHRRAVLRRRQPVMIRLSTLQSPVHKHLQQRGNRRDASLVSESIT